MRFLAVLSLAALLAGCADVKFRLTDPERDSEGNLIEWKEAAVTFPAYPVAANAIQFEGGNFDEARFYLDKASLSLGPDGVARYTLMIVGDGGARTVSYEGIRCDSREYRVYAYGRPDRTWAPPLESVWRPVQYQYINNYRGVLFATYLCKRQAHPPTPPQVIKELEREVSSVNRRAPYRD